MKATIKIFFLAGLSFVISILIVFMPMTYRVGINGELTVRHIPLYAKLGGFLYRDHEYRRIATEITGKIKQKEEKVLAVYNWTIMHIRTDQPEYWPVIDDHILDIIIRGYGESDQLADVFTTLCAYSGMPAYWRLYRVKDASKRKIASVVLSFVKLDRDNGWLVFDLYNQKYFRTDDGRIADIKDIKKDPGLVGKNVGDFKIKGVPYPDFFRSIEPVNDAVYLRPDKQMFMKRILFEITKLVKAR